MKFINKQVDILCDIKSEYKKYVITEGKNKVLFLILSKALYRTLKAAILWYKTLTDTLLVDGFKLNPYDLCIANKDVNDKQYTIIYHVDDMNISHVKESVARDVIELLELNFGKMKIKTGNEHIFLGMLITYHFD